MQISFSHDSAHIIKIMGTYLVNFNITSQIFFHIQKSLQVKLFASIFFILSSKGIAAFKEIKVGNDQEMAQSERNFHSKKRGGEKTKLTIRYLY